MCTVCIAGAYVYRNFNGATVEIPGTGRKVEISGLAVDLCENGLIKKHAAYYDAGDIKQQIMAGE